MEAYFDNSATTRCFEEVKDIVVKTMMEDFGNPSAMHQKGVDAEGYVKESARTLAQILKVTEKEILFTSGGTESNNLALIGGALANKRSGNHIITTAVEHAAVSQPVAFLQEQGFEVTILPVDGHGVVKLDALEKALRPDTILVSTMMVNNETGYACRENRCNDPGEVSEGAVSCRCDSGIRQISYLSEEMEYPSSVRQRT